MVFVFIIVSVFFVMGIIAIASKPSSVYYSKKSQKNPMQGKRVRFVQDNADPENADGVSGHLEAIGETCHRGGVYEIVIKRMIDIFISFWGIILLSPVFLVIAIWIVLDDPGPIIFTQKRVGKDKEFFKLHKFRSMKMCTPHETPTHMLENPELYITKSGKFIRTHSLDELPQIWDIFVGNMSLVGPRPALWNQDLLISERDKWCANDVKPGLTGWAQINGRDELEISEKAILDGEYVENLKFRTDAICFLRTIKVFGGDKSIVEGNRTTNTRVEKDGEK
jgi:O-antigen biosynthesis protein WbqP